MHNSQQKLSLTFNRLQWGGTFERTLLKTSLMLRIDGEYKLEVEKQCKENNKMLAVQSGPTMQWRQHVLTVKSSNLPPII